MNLTELRKAWKQAYDEARAIVNKAKEEKRELSADERTKIDEQLKKAGDLEADIARAEKLEALESRVSKAESTSEKEGAAPEITITREEGTDDKGNCIVFRNFGEQLMAVKEQGMHPHKRNEKLERCQKIMRAASGLSETQAADGGFLVQTDQASGLIKRAYDTAVLAPRCRKIGISSNSNSLKLNAIDESSRANGSRVGGIQAFWENEADAYTGSRPKFRQMELVLKKLTGLCYATEELLADAAALESVISDGFAEEFGFKLDDAIFRGTGAGQPLGIVNSAARVQVAKEGGQSANTVLLNNIVKMRARLWVRSRGNAVWLINQDVEPQLNVLSLSVGNNAYPVLLPASGISGLPYDTMFGRPVLVNEYSPTLSALNDIMLVDLSQYLLIDKGSMQRAASVHVRFIYDEMTYKFTYRVDGQPIWDKALTPYQGTNTVSPFIGLENR